MLNEQGPGKIDWTDYTWNPISGCKHGCSYCYMLRMEKRFSGIMKPVFHKNRLDDISGLKKPSKIFVGSSGDMWGDWLEEYQISIVLQKTLEYPQHTFQFLTKNPRRYRDFYLDGMDNCWFGTTFDGTDNTLENPADLIINEPDNLTKFVSFEPLLNDPTVAIPNIEYLDWIIIGADSTRGAKKPPKKWADWLIETARHYDIPVFVKDNYGYPETIKEFPK